MAPMGELDTGSTPNSCTAEILALRRRLEDIRWREPPLLSTEAIAVGLAERRSRSAADSCSTAARGDIKGGSSSSNAIAIAALLLLILVPLTAPSSSNYALGVLGATLKTPAPYSAESIVP